MAFQPLNNRVVIRKLQAQTQTKSGLYIPETSQAKPHAGEVLAVGPGKIENGIRIGMTVAVGDTVMFDHWKGTELKIGEELLLIVTEDDIVGIVND